LFICFWCLQQLRFSPFLATFHTSLCCLRISICCFSHLSIDFHTFFGYFFGSCF
jgi:hypothetical protein